MGRLDVKRVLVAGGAAGTAYLAAMWVDNRISSARYDDIKLVGQVFTTKSPIWQFLGVGGHYSFSMLMSLLYGAIARDRLPGPGWLRGLVFLQIENTLLYPLAALVEPHHAGVKAGELPTLLSRKAFQGQVVRHLAFGVVLGQVWGVKRKT